MKVKVSPESFGTVLESSKRAATCHVRQKCPVELFQTTATRSDENEQNSDNSKRRVHDDYLMDRRFTGLQGCPTELFMARSRKLTEDRKTDLFREQKLDENFKLVIQTKELNALSKESRLEWLIEAVGGEKKQKDISSEDTSPQKRGRFFSSLGVRLQKAWKSLVKITRRGCVDILKDAYA